MNRVSSALKFSSRVRVIYVRLRLPVCVLAAFLLYTAVSQAANSTWTASSGDWSTATNWAANLTPSSTSAAYINDGGTATISQSGEVAADLDLASELLHKRRGDPYK